MFGFSIYLSAPITSEIKKKINRLSKAGFSGVFTSPQFGSCFKKKYVKKQAI